MSKYEKDYMELVSEILRKGEWIDDDRTGVGVKRIFGSRLVVDVGKGYPLLTTKKMNFNKVRDELLWFLRGDTNTGWLEQQGSNIWKWWSDEMGNVGRIYGWQWRYWNNQLDKLVSGLKENPYSRRHVVSAWNTEHLPDESCGPIENVKRGKMCLAPCHVLWQCYVSRDKKLSIQVYQRSCDVMIGLPYNIASYALLLHMLSGITGYGVGRLYWVGGDTHIYSNHIDKAWEQLTREPYVLPRLRICKKDSLYEYSKDDFKIEGYRSHDFIRYDIAV